MLVAASAGATLVGLVVWVYVIGAVVALLVFQFSGSRSSRSGIRGVFRPGRRLLSARRRYALAWPVHVYRYGRARGADRGGAGLLPVPQQPGDPAAPPAGEPVGGLDIRRYGLINDEAD